jgi:6-phosphogluconolactonase (cycloisomerase 2 family)
VGKRGIVLIVGAAVLVLVLSVGIAQAVFGSLTFVEQEKDGVGGADGLNGASEPVVSPDGAHVYIASQVDAAVATFSRDGATGGLTFVELDKDGVAGVDGLADARELATSPDGAHVYVLSGGADNGVAAFSRDPSTGALTFVEVEKDNLNMVDGINGPSDVVVSPDGAHVYVTGSLDDAVATFTRGPGGGLTFLEMDKDEMTGGNGLNGANGVAIPPDGAHVYVSSDADDAVTTFGRSPSTGALAVLGQQTDGVNGVEGLEGATAVATSPDGAHVYVVSGVDDAITTFSRNPTTGALTFVEQDKDGVGGVDGLDGATGVAVSPDGAHVYATSSTDGAVATFSRDSVTGRLTFIELDKDGVDGVDGVAFARGVGVSPDGTHVYAAGFADDALAAFSREGLPEDSDPPETTITKGPKKKTKKRKAKFEFSSDEPGSTFLCKLDGKDFAPCDPAEQFKVKRRKHTLLVSAIDPAGNTDPTPAQRKWKVKKKKRNKR